MTDKDQFTFDDDDDFPETPLGDQQASPELDVSDDDFPESDLSAAFAEGEHSAESPDAEDTPEPKAKTGGNSRSRTLLLILLLVVVGGAGAFYFMDLGGTTPEVPTATIPAKTVSKSVALPPKPAPEPAAPSQPGQAAKPVSVTVPPPPPPAEQPATAPQVSQPAAVSSTPPATAEQPAEQKPTGQQMPESTKSVGPAQAATPAPQATAAVAQPEPPPVAQQPAAAVSQEAPPAASPMPAASPKQAANGAYALDAGSYLFESNRDMLVAKIKKLGYEPLVTPVDATLDMTRLRLGTFDKSEVQEALDFARKIEPGCYSSPAGDRYVIYAGTFLNSASVDKLTKRFLEEGITVHPEPVRVVRTLSRIRFGSFASKENAAAAAREISNTGLKVEVVKSR